MDGIDRKAEGAPVFRTPGGVAEWQAIHALRRLLFEPGETYDPAHPDDGRADHHVRVLAAGGTVIGTLRIDLTDPHWAAFRLVVVEPAKRNRGFGGAMLAAAEAFARAAGRQAVRLHAKPDAVQFYARHGYGPIDWAEPPRDPAGVNMGKIL
ncbi:MAG: GNAT family N-acetyltransferase [Magnetovibrio sp.]|nr:GNAT family N-acetyltransferase [Magnetovibrio sp.]